MVTTATASLLALYVLSPLGRDGAWAHMADPLFPSLPVTLTFKKVFLSKAVEPQQKESVVESDHRRARAELEAF